MISWYRYVPHDRVIAYLLAGWRWSADLGWHHGVYCSLFEWRGGGAPVDPQEE